MREGEWCGDAGGDGSVDGVHRGAACIPSSREDHILALWLFSDCDGGVQDEGLCSIIATARDRPS